MGSHLVDALVAAGARVTVADNLVTGDRRNLADVADRIDLHKLDLVHDDVRPLLAASEPETIFHLAAASYVPASVEDPRTDLENNIIATFNLLQAVRETTPAARVVHTSSAAVYGQGAGVPLHEDDPTFPVSPYGVSKLAAERYVAVFAGVYGLHTANVRLFPVYGPRLRKQVVYDLMCKVHANPEELFIIGDGTQVRDFTHAGDIVASLLIVADASEGRGEIYNVAADEPVTIAELATMICERMGVAPRFVYSGDVRAGEAQRWLADASRMATLGYRQRIALEDGLSDTVAWFRRDIAGS